MFPYGYFKNGSHKTKSVENLIEIPTWINFCINLKGAYTVSYEIYTLFNKNLP